MQLLQTTNGKDFLVLCKETMMQKTKNKSINIKTQVARNKAQKQRHL